MLKNIGQNETALRDARYDCVVHLVSAAIGAEQFYSKDTNAIRSESLDYARNLDSQFRLLNSS